MQGCYLPVNLEKARSLTGEKDMVLCCAEDLGS